jgi:hypothetical protein
VAYVFKNANSFKTFVNGTNTATVAVASTITVPNTTAPLYIGAGTATGARWFNGRIGLVRLYNAALTSSDILTNYNSSKATYGL